MADTSFESKIGDEHKGDNQHPKPPQRADSRKQKLKVALDHLEQAGIRGVFAYGPAFRVLAKMGLIIKPLHYWSSIWLMILFTLILCSTAALTIVAVLFVEHLPRALVALLELGPMVFLTSALIISLCCTALLKVQARRAELPMWQDL